MPGLAPAPRLWRMRRRHHHIDATLARAGAAWQLTFLRNDQPMIVWRYDDEAAARAEADLRRRDLERAGWTSHW
ncbi:MAG: hypothetical protein R2752_21095 [Vicinamibacterales bacterium]